MKKPDIVFGLANDVGVTERLGTIASEAFILEWVRFKRDYYTFGSYGVEIENRVIADSGTQIVDDSTRFDVRQEFLQDVLIMIEPLGLFNPAREMAVML
jgi:hypothetical protein